MQLRSGAGLASPSSPKPNATTTVQPFPFLSLPPELRTRVYDYVFGTDSPSRHTAKITYAKSRSMLTGTTSGRQVKIVGDTELPPCAILRVCKQLHSEAQAFANLAWERVDIDISGSRMTGTAAIELFGRFDGAFARMSKSVLVMDTELLFLLTTRLCEFGYWKPWENAPPFGYLEYKNDDSAGDKMDLDDGPNNIEAKNKTTDTTASNKSMSFPPPLNAIMNLASPRLTILINSTQTDTGIPQTSEDEVEQVLDNWLVFSSALRHVDVLSVGFSLPIDQATLDACFEHAKEAEMEFAEEIGYSPRRLEVVFRDGRMEYPEFVVYNDKDTGKSD